MQAPLDVSNQKINPSKIQVVYLGDYIDRGPQSWDVLQEVMREVREEEAIALRGNHEQFMLSVFSGDRSNMVNWLCNGGQRH